MNLKKAIIISIFIYTDEESELEKLGIGDKDSGFRETEERAFWTIDCAYPLKEDTNKTAFWVSGESFVSPIQFKEFVKLIDSNLKQTL